MPSYLSQEIYGNVSGYENICIVMQSRFKCLYITVFFVNAVPFVGFGFLDNFIMISAGDYIEHVFGTIFCLSTMAAAGLGNTISDVVGIGSAHYIERGCEIMGLRPPKLSTIQMEMKISRSCANWVSLLGVKKTLCLL